MKPIPPGFCYAADNAVIPGRPWWRGRRGLTDPGAGVTTRPGFDRFGGAGAATVEDAERIDREYPLPHPGYRAGQVWLVIRNGMTITLTITSTRQVLSGAVRIATSPSFPWGFETSIDGWLLFDPLMPHLAPWGPKE